MDRTDFLPSYSEAEGNQYGFNVQATWGVVLYINVTARTQNFSFNIYAEGTLTYLALAFMSLSPGCHHKWIINGDTSNNFYTFFLKKTKRFVKLAMCRPDVARLSDS